VPAQVLPRLNIASHPVTATVVTDFGVHSQWIEPKVGLFLVPSDEVKKFLAARKGIPPQNIRVTGIPIRLIYTKPVDVASVRQRFNLKEDFTVIMMAGEYPPDTVNAIARGLAELPLNLLVLSGRNQKALEAMDILAKENPRVRSFGIAKEIDELMRASDMLVGKAGGITVSEAMASSLPMVIYRPYPGQEMFNVYYLLKHRVGFFTQCPAEIVKHVKYLMANRAVLATMRQNAAALAKPWAARDVAEFSLQAYRNKSLTKHRF